MAKLTGISQIDVIVYQSRNLDTVCYRGEAPLAHLALISQADIFDQVTNPSGLQRDLSPKHASEVYEYVKREKDPDRPRAFPEVVLNVRDKKIIQMEELEDWNKSDLKAFLKAFRLRFDVDKMREGKVYVSRVDGNHRLYHAQGDDRGRDPLLVLAPFQLHIGLSREQEASIFVDINANQKGLNTSHLAIMQHRLTPAELEIKEHFDRWVTTKLANDPESPWHGIVGGGSKKGARAQNLNRLVNFVTLQAGVKKLLTKSQYIHDFTNPEAQYLIIRNYWKAVQTVFAGEWANPKEYLLLRNIGVTSLSILGGTIIDRCIPRSKYQIEDMSDYLGQTYTRFDWSNKATGDRSVAGMSGNQAATIIAGELANELSEHSGENLIKELQDKLLEQIQHQVGNIGS